MQIFAKACEALAESVAAGTRNLSFMVSGKLCVLLLYVPVIQHLVGTIEFR